MAGTWRVPSITQFLRIITAEILQSAGANKKKKKLLDFADVLSISRSIHSSKSKIDMSILVACHFSDYIDLSGIDSCLISEGAR